MTIVKTDNGEPFSVHEIKLAKLTEEGSLKYVNISLGC